MITVVSGAPCSGKTTYVQHFARSGDIVIDFDLIASAFGSPVPHDHSPVHVALARIARRGAIEAVLDSGLALGVDAWIVDTAPTHASLAMYARAGAVFEVCDPGRDVCLRRALADRRPEWTIAEIHRWYDTHTQESA